MECITSRVWPKAHGFGYTRSLDLLPGCSRTRERLAGMRNDFAQRHGELGAGCATVGRCGQSLTASATASRLWLHACSFGTGHREPAIDAPKYLPVVFTPGIQVRIPGHHRTRIRPFPPSLHQPLANRVLPDVSGDVSKRPALAIFFPEHIVVRLSLQFPPFRTQFPVPGIPQLGGGAALIASFGGTDPKEMSMIGHQSVGRTNDSVTRKRVAEIFAKPGVVEVVEPAGGPVFQTH
jgi:hypothetical protein